jgi:hypothetical protein
MDGERERKEEIEHVKNVLGFSKHKILKNVGKEEKIRNHYSSACSTMQNNIVLRNQEPKSSLSLHAPHLDQARALPPRIRRTASYFNGVGAIKPAVFYFFTRFPEIVFLHYRWSTVPNPFLHFMNKWQRVIIIMLAE